MSPILNTQQERRWVTDVLATRSGGVHDRVVGYLDLIDSLCGTVEALKKERADALGALTMLDTGATGSLADRVNELRALWAAEAHKRQRLQEACEALLAWPESNDPALSCEQATAQARAALVAAGKATGPSYTEAEVRQAVKYVSGLDSLVDTIDYLRTKRTAP
jgi:hypothetical protein